MEVSARGDLWSLLALMLPIYATMAVLAWTVARSGVISESVALLITAVVAVAYLSGARKAWQVNRSRLERGVSPDGRYSFRPVVVLSIAYMVTFGGEMAVASMLPQYFAEGFGLDVTTAALIAGTFTFWNLIGRPGGGWLADRFGRRRLLILNLAGVAAGYGAMSLISGWALAPAVAITFVCSCFVQAGCGAVYAFVPMVHKPMTGQVAGMVGAYGNVGAVWWLLLLRWVGPSGLFVALAAAGLAASLLSLGLREPSAAPVIPDLQHATAAD